MQKQIGRIGEELACKYLEEKGYQIFSKNFKRWGGEIDIVAEDPFTEEIVFVEVKTRTSTYWFELDQTLSESQIYHIKRTARRYLFETKREDRNWRVDHIAILLEENKVQQIEHFECI